MILLDAANGLALISLLAIEIVLLLLLCQVNIAELGIVEADGCMTSLLAREGRGLPCTIDMLLLLIVIMMIVVLLLVLVFNLSRSSLLFTDSEQLLRV